MSIKPNQTLFKVPESATKLSGTTANLKANVYISITDLFYGMMLPSGNDAAQTLAECLGALIYLY